MGTKRWSPPEYWDYRLEKGPNGDVYSFGVVLWELLTRQMPWDGVDEDKIAKLLFEGKTLEIPSYAPKQFKEILVECWKLGIALSLLYIANYRT